MICSNKIFFALGRVPCLSILELESVFSVQKEKPRIVHITPSLLLAQTNTPLSSGLITRLGGTIKMGSCVARLPAETLDMLRLAQTLSELVCAGGVKKTERITIGVSAYSVPRRAKNRTAWIKTLALEVKKILVEKGLSVRMVLPQKNLALTSVQVKKNRLVSKQGYEFVLTQENEFIVIGKTLAVQPFEEYSHRDWHRPAKAHEEGLLPPKIAQIMLNLARVPVCRSATILDPFCGSGTILQEALLMGYSSLIGSDKAPLAVTRTRENLIWLARENGLSLKNVRLSPQDATTLSSHVSHGSIDAIVAEPYLGPLFTRLPDEKKLQPIIKELSALYISFLYEARMVLKKNSLCVLVLPVWLAKKKIFVPVYERILSLGFQNNTIPDSIKHFLRLPQMRANITARNGILFCRPGSVVGRELFVFRSVEKK